MRFSFYVYTTCDDESEAREVAVEEAMEYVGDKTLDCRFEFECEGREEVKDGIMAYSWLVTMHGPTDIIREITTLYEKDLYGT